MKVKRLSAEPSCKLGNSHSFAFQPDFIESHAAALIGNICHGILEWSLLSENKIRYCRATLPFRFQMNPLLFMSQHWILTMQSGVSQWHICERPCLKWTHFRPEKPISLTSRVVSCPFMGEHNELHYCANCSRVPVFSESGYLGLALDWCAEAVRHKLPLWDRCLGD